MELVSAMTAPAFGLSNSWGRLAFNLALTILPYGLARLWPTEPVAEA